MKITSELGVKYLKKNKKRSMTIITRNNSCNHSCYICIDFAYELSEVFNKHS